MGLSVKAMEKTFKAFEKASRNFSDESVFVPAMDTLLSPKVKNNLTNLVLNYHLILPKIKEPMHVYYLLDGASECLLSISEQEDVYAYDKRYKPLIKSVDKVLDRWGMFMQTSVYLIQLMVGEGDAYSDMQIDTKTAMKDKYGPDYESRFSKKELEAARIKAEGEYINHYTDLMMDSRQKILSALNVTVKALKKIPTSNL